MAVAAVAGALAGTATTVSAATAVAVAIAAAALAVAVDVPRLRTVAAFVALCAAVTSYATTARTRALAPPLTSWLAEVERQHGPARSSGPVLVEGRLARDAEPADSGARLSIDVERLVDDAGPRDVSGRIQAVVGGERAGAQITEWTEGRRVQAPIILGWPPMWFNPGGPDARWQTLRRRFDLTGSIKSAMLIRIAPGPWRDEVAASVRAHVRVAVNDAFGPARSQSAAIALAVLIGDRGGLDDGLERRLQVAGTYHVIAISGGNIALLTAWLWLGLRLLTRSPRLISLFTLAGVLAYGAIASGDASVSRAVVAASIYLLCGLVGLRPAALDVLAVVALALVLNDPLIAVDVGAWLSFGATLGIILCARRFAGWYERWSASGVSPPSPPSPMSRVAHAAAALFSATLAAELALLPVSALVFSRVGIAGLALNFIAIPMMAVIQMAGLVIALGGMFQSAYVAPVAWIGHVATRALVDSARLVDIAPWLSWRVPPPAMATIVLFYAASALWLRADAPRLIRRAAGVVALVFALDMAFAPGTFRAAPARGWLRLTAIDVGQGDAMLLQLPSGQSLLVDAGGASGRFDVGDRVVAPALWASGVRRLDWLMVTHADLDHIGGAASVVANFHPREIWDGVPVARNRERQALRDLAVAGQVSWRQVQRGDELSVGGVELTVLNPPLPDWERPRVRNDDSVVIRVRFGDAEFLLTGDIGDAAERDLSLADDRARIRVLKVAHHGSRTSSSVDFLQAYAPQVAIASAGRSNPFGHPSPEVLDRLDAAGARVFRTDRDGATIVETDGVVVNVRAVLGRRWTVRMRPPPV